METKINTYKAELIEHVEGLGDIYRVCAPLPQQIQALNDEGIKSLVSVRDASYIRLHGKNREGTRTCHAPIYAKDCPVIVARNSPLMTDLKMAQQAVDAHRNNQYPVFDNDKSIYAQWEKLAKADKDKKPENRRAIALPERGNFKIHRDSDIARFFFQDTRKDYFKQHVSGDSIPCLQINPEEVDAKDGTIVNYVWFDGPRDGSDLYFRLRDLDNGDRALGVLKKTGFASSQKVLPYTTRQVERASKIIRGVREGKLPASKLEKVSDFLEILRK